MCMRIIMHCRTQYCTEQNFLSNPQTIIIAQMISTGVEGVLDYKGLNSSKVSKLKTKDDRNRLTLILHRFYYSASQWSHCKRCSSYSNSVRMSVRLSVRPSVRLTHAGIVSKRLHVPRCSLHCQIAKCV